MKAEDGTGSRRPSWRCGNVTPPISFDISSEQLRLLTFLMSVLSDSLSDILEWEVLT